MLAALKEVQERGQKETTLSDKLTASSGVYLIKLRKWKVVAQINKNVIAAVKGALWGSLKAGSLRGTRLFVGLKGLPLPRTTSIAEFSGAGERNSSKLEFEDEFSHLWPHSPLLVSLDQ